MMKDKDKKLTIKQEKFCQLVIELGNQSEAYRQAYNVKATTKDETVWVDSCQLSSNPNVAQRIAELRSELAKSNIMDKEEIMQHLKDIMDSTKKSTKEKAIALKAIDQYTKMIGGYEAEKHEIKQDINIGFGGMENLEIEGEQEEDDQD